MKMTQHLIALILVPCLLMDPMTAHALQKIASRPGGKTAPQKNSF